MAIAIVFALLLQDLAASALVSPGPVALSSACQAALAAGDNERESFLSHSCDRTIGAAATLATPDDRTKRIVTIWLQDRATGELTPMRCSTDKDLQSGVLVLSIETEMDVALALCE